MSLTKTYIALKRSFSLTDLFILLAIAAFLYGLIDVAQEWGGRLQPTVAIDLSPWALPKYTFFSLVRGFIAYGLSLVFTLCYGYVAAYNRRAERIMIPLLDILQSIPVLGFLPGLVLAFAALFPHSNTGLELAAILMIFTGQVWNMTFSFFHSLQSIPNDLREVARVHRFNSVRRFVQLELPYSSIGLVWNSMMSMAGGWFFLTVSESFIIGDKDFRLPGIGAYMSVAITHGDGRAILYAIIAMGVMIVAVDQLFWKPLVVWSQKFKIEDTGDTHDPRSSVLAYVQRSRLLPALRKRVWKPLSSFITGRFSPGESSTHEAGMPQRYGLHPAVRWLFRGAFAAVIVYAASQLILLLADVSPNDWLNIARDTLLTFLRVTAAVVLGTLWTIPAGVAIGTNPRLSRVLQPVTQVVASFPAPMVFPLVLLLLADLGGNIEYGAIVLMMLGTQWYILFNVIAGASAIPHDLKEVSMICRLSRRQQWRRLILPAIFPALVTGWVAASGGAWNASIVAEYVHYGSSILTATGLGSRITLATDHGKFGVLAASVLAMSTTVVIINRFFWKRLFTIADQRFSLNT